VPYRCEPVAEVEGTPRGIEISAVGRTWRLVLAVTCFVVIALLLVGSIAAANSSPPCPCRAKYP